MKILQTHRSFKKEFRKQLRFAITAAVGFSVAFAWRESIFDLFQNFISRFFDLELEHYSTEIYTAIAITLAGVLLIFLTSKILKER